MKSVSTPLRNHYKQECTTIATCWRCQRRDGAVFTFTDHDRPLEVASEVYEASSGYTASAIASDSSLAVDNLDLEGFLDSASITEDDLLAGLWDYAEIRIFEVNWADTSMGVLRQRKGRIGNVTTGRQRFNAEMRGLTQNLQQQIGLLVGAGCSADVGDARCKVNLAALKVESEISARNDDRILFDSARTEDDGHFDFGKITFTSGENDGISMEVKRYIKVNGMIELVLPMPFAVEIGDTYEMTPGCDKTAPTCISKYNNILNYRGFRTLPGVGRLLSSS